MGRLTYQAEEDKLLHTILDKRFFAVWRNPEHKLFRVSSMELYITTECNLKCEYCYLNTRGDLLYPKEHRDKEAILTNLDKLLKWMLDEGFHLNELELFSGEIWHMPFGFDVLETILYYVLEGLKIYSIMIPTNSSFLLEDSTLNQMQDMIDRFSKAGCRLMISHSIEGLLLEDISRPMKNGSMRHEDFYDRVFAFAKKNTFYFHPMVAAANIEKWIENYDWFKGMCAKYDLPFPRSVMMLEVRNADWAEEKLEHLKRYYKHQIEHHWEKSGCDFNHFIAEVFGIGSTADENLGYSNISMPPAKTQAGCSIPFTLTVRVGDLAIVPCHRTAYPQFSYGKFLTDAEGKISGLEAINTQAATKVLYSNVLTGHHGCDVCRYNDFCLRCCYGEQYESTEEIFMPDENVCRMFKAKYNFLIDTYEEMGLWKHMAGIPATDVRYMMTQSILSGVDRINEGRRAGDA